MQILYKIILFGTLIVFANCARMIIENNMNKYLKVKTKGKIIDFVEKDLLYVDNKSHVTDINGIDYNIEKKLLMPLVEYFVDGVRYTQILSYRYVYVINSDIEFNNSKLYADENKQDLVVRYKGLENLELLKDCFPIGKEIDVFYDKKNPEDSYVLRFAENVSYKSDLMVDLIIGILGSIATYICTIFM